VKTHDLNNYWLLELEETQITRLMFDAAFILQLVDGERGTEVRIETPFVVFRGNVEYSCDPSHPPSLVPVLDFFLKTVQEIRVYKTGELRLNISPDIIIRVFPHDTYEAWNITSNHWLGATAMPGGSVAFWQLQTPH
jgi:hypothetical protein